MDPVLREVISRYRDNRALQLFAYLRSRHANYELIEKYVPREGLIVDVGSGHGMFANYLGLKSPARSVTGLEINKRKLTNASRGVANVTFSDQRLENFEKHSVDAIVFYHVLHHLSSYDEQERLLRLSLEALKPEGKLVIVEIARNPLWKFVLCWLVDHTLYFGDHIYFRFKEEMLDLLRRRLGLKVQCFMCDSQSPLPHIAYVASRAGALEMVGSG